MELTRGFWAGRRVFLTGHTGFKGSWMVVVLRELGAQVFGYSLPAPTEPSLFELAGLGAYCAQHTLADIKDAAALTTALRASRAEVVIHMAAQPLVRASYTDPVDTYAVNVMGTVNLLEACRQVEQVRAVVVVTTDKCYENLGWVWGYRENDRLGGHDPYSNSKAAAELVVAAYRDSFLRQAGKGLASARAGNVIGGGDFAADRLVPDAMRAFMAGEPLPIRNPLSIRPWQHVLEPVHGYLLLAERLWGDASFAEGWNFGPQTHESASVADVVDMLARQWGVGAGWQQDPAEHPHEAATLKLDSTKARLQLGWAPKLSLDAALQLTTDWFRAWQRGDDVAGVTGEQVRSYLG